MIDPVWLAPLDTETIAESIRRTGHLCMVDNGWTMCGAGAEIVARVMETLQGARDIRVRRLGFAPVTCPPTPPLEDRFYPNAQTIASAAYELVRGDGVRWSPAAREKDSDIQFRGPF